MEIFLLMTGKRQCKQKASLHPMSCCLIAHFEKRNISTLLDLSAVASTVTFQQKGSRFGGGGSQVKRHAHLWVSDLTWGEGEWVVDLYVGPAMSW